MITRTQNLNFRLARQEDFSALQAIYNDAGHWLHDVRGISDQWDREMAETEVQSLINQQETYLVYRGETWGSKCWIGQVRGPARQGNII